VGNLQRPDLLPASDQVDPRTGSRDRTGDPLGAGRDRPIMDTGSWVLASK